MPHFNVILHQKQKLREALLNDQQVCNLLCNKGLNILDFENVRLGSKGPASELIKTHFFVPGTVTSDKNYIVISSDVPWTDTKVIKETQMTLFILCNNDNIDLIQGSRADFLADAVDRIVNNGSDPLFGFGGIRLGYAQEMQFTEGYTGWKLPYVTHEPNRKWDRLN